MVTERESQDAPWKHFLTDDGLWEIKTKDLTLERFQDKMAGPQYKADRPHRWNCIERWILAHLKPWPRTRVYAREELLKAADELKEYLFPRERWN